MKKEYEVIKFIDFCDIDTIMDWDESCWEKLSELEKDKHYLIDMLHVHMSKPYNSIVLKQLLKSHPLMRFKIYNNQVVCHSLNTLCNMMGIDERFEYEEHWVNGKPRDKKEVEFEEEVNEVIELMVINEDKEAELNVSCFRTILNRGEIRVIKEAFKQYSEKENCSKLTLNMGYISLSSDDVAELIKALRELEEKGIKVEFNSNNESLKGEINMQKAFRKVSDVSLRERQSIIKNLGENFPCMFMTYKDGKGFDEYGRRRAGNAVEILSCRAAIVRGIENGKVIIDTFKLNHFYPVGHWSVMYDGNIPDELPRERISVNLKDVGVINEMLGVKYHIGRAIQYSDNKDYCSIHEMVDNFNSETVEVTIPERFRRVFDSWGVEYNKNEINECIELTLEELGKNSNKD